ncbi:MAG: hypothetical protein ACREVN_08505, partial [Gammaproteobacteria bacterium]
MRIALPLFLVASLLAACTPSAPPDLQPGTWRVSLTVPGGELPLTMEVSGPPEAPQVHFVNGAERVAVPDVRIDGNRVA